MPLRHRSPFSCHGNVDGGVASCGTCRVTETQLCANRGPADLHERIHTSVRIRNAARTRLAEPVVSSVCRLHDDAAFRRGRGRASTTRTCTRPVAIMCAILAHVTDIIERWHASDRSPQTRSNRTYARCWSRLPRPSASRWSRQAFRPTVRPFSKRAATSAPLRRAATNCRHSFGRWCA